MRSPPPTSASGVWTGATLGKEAAWTYAFAPAQVGEIARACDRLQTFTAASDQHDFDSELTSLAPILDAHARELREGKGVARLRGLPLDAWGPERARIAFWIIGSRFGRAVNQTSQGSLMVDVMDVSGELKSPRQFKTSQELRLHTDPASDVMGLACLQDARSGGETVLASAAAIHNEMLSRRPDLLALLYEGFYCHRFGEGRTCDQPVSEYKVPVFAMVAGQLSCRYVRSVIVAGQKDRGEPLTFAQVEALDLFDALAGSSDLHIGFRMQPGDIVLVNNLTVLHARTRFEDHEERARRRHVLRLWLDGGPRFRESPRQLNFFNGGEEGIPLNADATAHYDMDALGRDPAIGPPPHLPWRRRTERLVHEGPMKSFHHVEVRPITGTLGAEVHGVDLRSPLSPPVLHEVLRAFDERLLLTFANQELSPEQHLAFSELLGPHQDLPHIPLMKGYPQLQEVRREADDAKSKVTGQNWHSDSSFLEAPPLGVVMRALEIPQAGGDTAFVNMCEVYESLSAGMKEMLGNLKAVHSATRVFGKAAVKVEERSRMRENADVEIGEKESLHPVVRTHPRTGRKGIYVNRVYTQRFEGMTSEESQPLLSYLYSLFDKPEFGCRLRWHRNMVLLWDNRFTQHRAIVDYHGQRRHLVRTTIQGERPA